MTCREKDSLIKPIASRLHLMNDVELYSLRDLLDIPQDVLIDFIREVTEKFLLHIKSCQVNFFFSFFFEKEVFQKFFFFKKVMSSKRLNL